MSELKTILLVIPRTFSVRAFLMTTFIERLAQSVNVAILSPFGDNPDFVKRFERQNVSFYKLPDFQDKYKWWHNLYSEIMNANWNLKSKDIENDLRSYLHNRDTSHRHFFVKYHIKQLLIYLLSKSHLFQKYVRNKEKNIFWECSQLKEYEKIFLDIKPDIIISTKSAIWDEYPIARFGEKYSIPQITYVLSFDNITTNGVFPTNYDKWLVWNDINKGEILKQYIDTRDKDVTVCGPLQFDFYSNTKKYILEKKELFYKLELDLSRPLLLLGAGPQLIAPQEPYVALQIAQAIRNLNINGKPQFLIRLHPDDRLDRWKNVISEFPEVHFSLPWELIDESKSLAIPTDDDIRLLASTLAHSDVVINTSSSMAIDAAIFDRPVLCLAYDERPGKLFDLLCKKLYDREHYVPIVESGGVMMAYSHDQSIQAINTYLKEPERDRQERLNMVRLFDPFGDGKAGIRTANAILDYLGEIEV